MRRTAACLFILVNLACVRASANIGCPSADVRIPIHVPPEIDTVTLSDLGIAAWNGLDAQFLLTNRAGKGIAYLTLVLDFQMKKGKQDESVVFEAAPDTRQPSTYLIPAEHVEPLPRPILAGQQKWISGTSPYTPPECPVSARPIMLDIHFGDGSSLKWESPDWWTEPLLYDYPTYLDIPDSKAWTSEEYFFTGRVNCNGQLDQVAPFPSTSQLPSGTVAEALKKLTFSPGLDKGKAVVANLIFIVRFKSLGVTKTVPNGTVPRPTISKPVVFIDLYPRDSTEIGWGLSFGRGFGYTTTVTHRER